MVRTLGETPVAPWNPPSTILIVNISNSTLIDCVIGNDTYPSTVAESQPLMQEPQHHVHDHLRCSYSHRRRLRASVSTAHTSAVSSSETTTTCRQQIQATETEKQLIACLLQHSA
ncbi:hypothetical protein INR49_026718 [Caranx melampygus]|nr:hypothetical protein INR49_026718 [Caranx melampygus]